MSHQPPHQHDGGARDSYSVRLLDPSLALTSTNTQRSGRSSIELGGSLDRRQLHRWRSPTIVKTRPEYVAYTCARCGAIGLVAAGESLSKLRGWSSTDVEPASVPLECPTTTGGSRG